MSMTAAEQYLLELINRARLAAICGGAALDSAAVIAAFADVVGADVVFDFGNGQTITLPGISTLAGLDQGMVLF